MRLARAFALLLSLSAGAPALAAETATPFATIADKAITDVIRPGYDRLDEAGGDMEVAMGELCAHPGEARLDAARDRFSHLVEAWSRIELIRFGPVREDYRYEKILYWPDRKGLGRRQVRQILKDHDPDALDVADLRGKSVAVQGLGALEFVLFGKGANGLIQRPAENAPAYRCHYGLTIAGAIHQTASELVAAWKNDTGYPALMRAPGPDNPVYQAEDEVVRELLRSMTEELQFARDIKLARPLGESADKARYKRAPFWRSGLTLTAVSANAHSVGTMFKKADFAAALPEEEHWLGGSISFELAQAQKTLARIDQPVERMFIDKNARDLLAVAIIALNGAGEAIGGHYAGATGLTVGFNSLDGD